MPIAFNPSRGPSLGVEWELQLVDKRTRRLRQDARMVLEAIPDLSETPRPKVMHELMQSQLEIITDVCHTVGEALHDLRTTIDRLREVVDPQGMALACTGTHAISDWRDAVYAPVQRYTELVEEMQWLAWRIQTFGVHVHVGVRDRDKVIPIVNALAAYLPHFLALTASSPYWGGQDTGLASSRAIVFGALPTAGPPQMLADWAEFEEYMDTLKRAGTIKSIKEVWWDIRPHPDFGTIEIRMFDGIPTLREVGMVTALSQCLVQQFDQQLDRGYRLPHPAPWVVRDNKWRATRYGLDAFVITDDHGSTAPMRDMLYELARELAPVAERLGCADELATITDVVEQGNSCERQRTILNAGGTLDDVVDATIAELAEDRFVTTNLRTSNGAIGHAGK
ncbi:putative glutamate--cysteine ligase 2 [Sphaerisporangium melleum]|uniref:Putative glutamate--cysteine ligase 2 n=1 Tax=Sphaerisporangium melleum TaxID=321316 RepID=A0A917QZ81_9ACTN|nr:glutamate--cysteine ligase [Sphaerisporangium melleum]GGK76788.1 putative glutamate--cysteine ligase 2 [Sphaerisporangium melleum]GII71774.1 putative glutamate--cysteine ligase 2 [Sphaerisporangium melleum]